MNRKLFTIIAALIMTATVITVHKAEAQNGVINTMPKREFRGAWIQTVNGQYKGMPRDEMQRINFPGAARKPIKFIDRRAH